MKREKPAKGTKEKYNIILNMFKDENEITNISDGEDTKPIDEVSKKWDMNDRILELFSDTIERDQGLKEKYAIILIIILCIQLIALITVFVLKGCELLTYSDSTFNIFISGGIAEVFILVRVIVKYLFKDNLTSALNTILENNNKIRQTKNNSYKNNKSNNNNNKKN